MIFGKDSTVLATWALGVTFLSVIISFTISLRADRKVRRWVLEQGLALVPGLLFDIVVLILNLL